MRIISYKYLGSKHIHVEDIVKNQIKFNRSAFVGKYSINISQGTVRITKIYIKVSIFLRNDVK
jgi:hypothetical protein